MFVGVKIKLFWHFHKCFNVKWETKSSQIVFHVARFCLLREKCFSRFLSHLMNVNKWNSLNGDLCCQRWWLEKFPFVSSLILFYFKIFTFPTYDILRIMMPFSLSWREFREDEGKFIKILICFCYYVRSWEWMWNFEMGKFHFG